MLGLILSGDYQTFASPRQVRPSVTVGSRASRHARCCAPSLITLRTRAPITNLRLLEPRPDRKLDVVFVHGLGDNGVDAWQQEGKPTTFWPSWLANDFNEVQVRILRYPAPQTKFEPMAMVIPDRAAGILDLLIDKGVGERDILFVAHSLGGIIVKQLLD
jgi:hypothetical protein